MRAHRFVTLCSLGALASCELTVQLDRSAAPEEDAGCAICSYDAAVPEASSDASLRADADTGATRIDSSGIDGAGDAP